MSSASGFPSLLLRNTQNAYRSAIASITGSKAAYSYQPLDPSLQSPTSPSTSTSTSTAARRGPRTLLQTRWAKLLLAGALLVSLGLVASAMTDVPSTIRNITGGSSSGGSKTTSPESPGSLPPDARPSSQPLTLQSARAAMTKEEYIAAVLDNPVEGLLDPAPIRAMCDATKFQEGLVWHCELVNGGIGNVGNMWLNCLRYAIEAGATTIILPRIGARSEDDLHNLGDDDHSVELATLYDVDFFLSSWPDACPQMRAVVDDADVPNLPPRAGSPTMKANEVARFPRIKELVLDPTGWREAFDAWLDKYVPASHNMTAAAPVRVRQRLALSNWNREVHTDAFARAFPRLFRFHERPRRLAAAALWSLEQMAGRAVVADAVLFPELTALADADDDADKSAVVTSLGPRRLADDAFLGAHLRVAEDAAAVHWPGYEAQAPAYLDEAAARNLSLVYLATGSEEHRARFHADAAARGVRVVTKEELLSADELAELRGLSWDQEAIVDFDVLVHSSHFAGFVRSSFSWVVAVRRSILPEAGTPVITRREEAAAAPRTVRRREGHARRQGGGETPETPKTPETPETAATAATAAAPPANPPPAAAAPPATPPAPASPPAPAPATVPIVEKYRDGLSVVVGRYDAMTIMGIWP